VGTGIERLEGQAPKHSRVTAFRDELNKDARARAINEKEKEQL